MILLISLASQACRAPGSQVPQDLIGEWHATDPNYSDRWLRINAVSIDFVTRGKVSTGFIKEVRAVPEGSRTLYTISYLIDGTPNRVSFYLEVGEDKTIRFKQQENVIWKKDKTPTAGGKK